MSNDIMQKIAHIYKSRNFLLLVLSIVTALVAFSAIESTFSIDGGPRATYFLCFCVSFSAYQIVNAINKNTEILLKKISSEPEKNEAILKQISSAGLISKKCVHCGKPLVDGANFCMYCGKGQKIDTP